VRIFGCFSSALGGIHAVKLPLRSCVAVAIPRSDLATAKARAELDHVAVYFLFGESEGAAKPNVDIGQTEDVRKRLDQHNTNKDFWQVAVLGISRTDSFTQAHIRYLEWYCLEQAQTVGRFNVENGNTPSKPFVTEKLSHFEAAEVAINHSLRRAARLRQRILKQAFEGKLVPEDTTDEPASMLLE